MVCVFVYACACVPVCHWVFVYIHRDLIVENERRERRFFFIELPESLRKEQGRV